MPGILSKSLPALVTLPLALSCTLTAIPAAFAEDVALKSAGLPTTCGEGAMTRQLGIQQRQTKSDSVLTASRSIDYPATAAGADTTTGAPVAKNTASAGSFAACLNDKPIVAATFPNTQVGAVDKAIDADGPIVVDNDEPQEEKTTIEYKELETDAAGMKAIVGAKFPVVFCSQINTKTAQKGDSFEARLKYDLKIGDRLVAKKGSLITGHVSDVVKARTPMRSLVSGRRWYRSSGVLSITFEELINEKGEHFTLVAKPAQKPLIIKNVAEGRELGVNHNGEIVGPWAQQLRWKAVRIGIDVGISATGPFALAAMPAAMGVVGAIDPSLVFMRPIPGNMRHRRVIGFVWGAIGGLPGAWAVEDSLIRGQDAVLKPGDEFLAELKQEFTGVPQTDASLIPGSSTKVHGEVIPEKKED